MKKMFFIALALPFMGSSLMAEYTMEQAKKYAEDMCIRNRDISSCKKILIGTKMELEKLKEYKAQQRSKNTKSNKANKKRQEDYCAPNNPYC